MNVLEELVKLLALERIEENLFRGQSQDLGWGTVFGGQVLGQALSAAAQTVTPDRHVHSMHAYFLRPGDVHAPVVYDVDRIRDGKSFTTRRVVAIQHGKPIFNLAASFQVQEEGLTHQDPMPEVPGPENLMSDHERFAAAAPTMPSPLKEIVTQRLSVPPPIELRMIDPDANMIKPTPRPPKRMLWLKATGPLPDNPALHSYLLAYASDFSFVTTSLLPHGLSWLSGKLQIASIDHVMWFHRPIRVDEWLLYVMDSPNAHGARGLARGLIYSKAGELVASTAQEGLIRARPSSRTP